MHPNLAWAILFVAGLFEVGWAIGLKYTEGFTRLVPSALTLSAMILSIVLLGLALKTLPVGTAYAVWTGIGAVGTAALGIYLFGEPATAARLASIGLIVAPPFPKIIARQRRQKPSPGEFWPPSPD
jgi:quaternary ammonium compound-resistance protein SugE